MQLLPPLSTKDSDLIAQVIDWASENVIQHAMKKIDKESFV